MPHLLNGRPAEAIGLQDRGLQYGDGLFETVAVRQGRLEFWQAHLQRLQLGCQRLGIPAPEPELLLTEARQLLEETREATVLKIMVTRGEGGRGYRGPVPAACRPNRILSRHPWPDYPEHYATQGVSARICDTPLGINPALAGLKHLNRLEQVMARNEWRDEGIYEGLMLDLEGHVVEGTMSNLFFVKDGRLHTPDVSRCGVAGITRAMILELARRDDIPVAIGQCSLADLEGAEELLISNALIGIWPVNQLGQRRYPVGAMTHQLMGALNRARCDHHSHETA